jgi:hypothetical protein
MRTEEDTIQQHAVKFLTAFGRADVAWFAVPNGEKRHASVGAKLKRQGVRTGAPDLVFLIDGHFHGVELKALKGSPSPAQIAFRLDIERAGGSYHLCRGLDEAIACFEAISVLQPNIRLRFPATADRPCGVRERPRA